MSERLAGLLDWMLQRFSEQSTWKGVVLLFSQAGWVTTTPEKAAAISAAGLAAVALINIFRNEKKQTTAVVQKVLADNATKPPTP